LIGQLRRDPITQEYCRRVRAGGYAPLRDPIDVIGEMRVAALSIATGDTGLDIAQKLRPIEPSLRAHVSDSLMRAKPFLWEPEIWGTAWSMDVPDIAIGEDSVPAHPHYFSLTRDYFGFENPGEPVRYIRWVAFWTSPFNSNGGRIAWFVQCIGAHHSDHTASVYGIYFGRSVSEIPEPHSGNLKKVLALKAFADSPALAKEVVHAPRPMRRRSSIRETPPATFVTLRKIAQTGAVTDIHDTSTRNYSTRWLVSGHMRAQWYPSTSSHRLIYIAPHVKGPIDKPLKMTAYKVAR
jgi:hypothetical protein